MSTFDHLIADYGPADPAFSEVVHRLTGADPTMTVQSTESSHSRRCHGFRFAQLGSRIRRSTTC